MKTHSFFITTVLFIMVGLFSCTKTTIEPSNGESTIIRDTIYIDTGMNPSDTVYLDTAYVSDTVYIDTSSHNPDTVFVNPETFSLGVWYVKKEAEWINSEQKYVSIEENEQTDLEYFIFFQDSMYIEVRNEVLDDLEYNITEWGQNYSYLVKSNVNNENILTRYIQYDHKEKCFMYFDIKQSGNRNVWWITKENPY